MKHQFRYKNIYFEQQEKEYLGKRIFIGYWNYRPVCNIKWDTSQWRVYARGGCIGSDQLQDIVDFLVYLTNQEE